MRNHIAKPRAAILALVALALGGNAGAALDPQVKSPYKVQVVLRFADNRLLTPYFHDEVLGELREGLRAALGAMGEVEVFDLSKVPADKRPPLWRAVDTLGLQQGLDRADKDTSEFKTHFLVIDYVEGQYEVQSRQYDGLTGQPSAAVRKERTPDRKFVARTAALLVDRDFGVVGTVVEAPDAGHATVAFRGGQLGVPLDRWVKKDDVFALVRMTSGGAGLRAAAVPWSILQAAAAPDPNGLCPCKVFQPRLKALVDGEGYRCLKLGTVRGPLRIRLTRDEYRNPAVSGITVQVRTSGFEGTRSKSGVPEADGYYSTEKANIQYDGVAFVTILQAGHARAQVPIPIVDDRTVGIRVNLGDEATLQVLLSKGAWETALVQELLFQNELVKSINDMTAKPDSRGKALDTAKRRVEELGKFLDTRAREQTELTAEAKKVPAARVDLTAGESYLKELRQGCDKLQQFASGLEAILKEENDPSRVEAKTTFEQARLSEAEEDYAKALELYEKVLANPNTKADAKLRERVERLKEAWRIKDDAHKEAHDFFANVWPVDVGPAALKERIAEARKHFETCKRVKDPLRPRRLLKAATAHVKRLAQQLESLMPDVNTDDEKPAKELADAGTALAQLMKDVQAYVKSTPVP